MAEETKTTAAESAAAAAEVVEVAEEVTTATEKEVAPEVVEKAVEEAETAVEPAAEDEKPKEEEEKITESASFKEETNVVGELPDPQKKALDELKQLVHEALNKHEFTAPPPPPPAPAKVEEKAAPEEEPAKTEEKPAEEVAAESKAEVEAKAEEKPEPAVAAEEPPKAEEAVEVAPAAPVETKEKETAAPPPPAATEPSEPSAESKVEAVVEAIKETIIEEVTAPPPPPTAAAAEESTSASAEEPKDTPAAVAEVEAESAAPPPPEEVSIWGIPLLADEKSDVILLKFLRARDFKVKEAFAMLKSVVAWRKEFAIERLIEEEFGTDLEKVVYIHGVDKEGHPVCYNAYGEFQNKELYQNTFSDEEKTNKFLRWRIQFLEKSIRKLDFSPDGICTFVQVNDLKNSPGLFQRELRQATNLALQLLQDNYPEFVAKQVFINVPWWYLAFYRMISPFFTQRTKSKFVFAGPSKSAETLFKYIAPEQVPAQYGGLSREGEQEFSSAEPATEEIIKPATKQCIEFPVTEAGLLVWELRVIGWDVTYGAEFVPSAEDGYTVIVQKSRKIGSTDEPVISGSYKIGEPGKVVLTIDNQTSKKKKLLYRSKAKPSD